MTGWIAAQTGLATPDTFLAGIENQKFECSFRSYPQIRYSSGKIEALAADQILTTLTQVTQLEPGILQATYRDGSYALLVFTDDLKAFVIGTMSEMSSFSISGSTAPSKLPVAQRRNWVAYEEYGRMVSLFNSGDRSGAQTLAKEFIGRFSNLQEINIRNDIDPITVKLTRAIADPTPANIAELEQIWSAQVGSLKNRPLKNFTFARVMVATLAKLKGRG